MKYKVFTAEELLARGYCCECGCRNCPYGFKKGANEEMSKPTIADRKPTVIELEPGTYYWCKCGLSKKQPFCDGSHKGTSFSPKPFEVQQKLKMALCNCKHTGNPPLCDGTHAKL